MGCRRPLILLLINSDKVKINYGKNKLCTNNKNIVQLLSTKIVQISDTSIKLSQITKGKNILI